MAEESKQTGAAAGGDAKNPAGSEASAADLLSLWGTQTPTSAPREVQKKEEIKPSAAQVTQKASSPAAPDPKPTVPTPNPEPTPAPPAELTQILPAPKPAVPASNPEPISSFPAPAPPSVPAPPLPPPPRPVPKAQQADWFSTQAPQAASKRIEASPQATPAFQQTPTKEAAKPSGMPKSQIEPSQPAPEPKPTVQTLKPESVPASTSKSSQSFSTPPPPPPPKQKPIEGEIVSAPPKQQRPHPLQSAHLDEPNGFKSQIDEFLHELNLSRRHIYIGIGCLIGLIVLIIGGVSVFKYLSHGPSAPAEERETLSSGQALAKPDTAVSGIAASSEAGKPTIISAESIGSTGVAESAAVGAPTEQEESLLATYILTFRRIQNAYAVNINELLDSSTDRRARLESHIALLKNVSGEGNVIRQKIVQEMSVLQNEFKLTQDEQRIADENFFTEIAAFNGETASAILDDFIATGKEIVALRARYKALQKVKSFYDQGMPKLENRIKDIELNEDALVAGIKIYDVTGSDLDLIVPVQGSSGSLSDSFSGASFPLIPVRPSQVNTGRDFITSPGGGF